MVGKNWMVGSRVHAASLSFKCSSYERSSLATYQLNHSAVLNDAFPFAYPINQSNSFPESDNKPLILKGSLFSARGLGLAGMGRGTESIRPFREELPLEVRDYIGGEVRKPLPHKACSAGRRHKKR
jgi:hypothetical protein